MNKLFCLVGKSSSGKTAVGEELVKNYGYKKIISYTTRLPREGEVNGKDYYFITEDEFIDMLNKGQFAGYNSFDTKEGYCYYGTHKNDINKLKEKNNLIHILEPNGIKQLINSIGSENIVPILLERESWDRMYSSLTREPHASNKKVAEMIRRFEEDEEDFIEIEGENIKVIHNKFIGSTTHQVNEYIQGNEHLYWKCENNILTGDKIRIDNIKTEDGKHLSKRIGQEGVIVSYIIKYGQKRYKVKFNDDDTAYFFRSELEKIEEEGR